MCGIVGAILKTNSGFTKQVEDVLLQLLYADALRGEDSTGVIGVEKDTTFHIMKEAAPSYFFNDTYLKSKLQKNMWNYGKAVIGHNRKKTIGAIADETAHPFVIGDDFAMVHNGTLYNHRKLANTEVDSEALATVLAEAFKEVDYKEKLEETLGKVEGAYATAMYDQRHNKVRLLRNKERPLSVVETPNAWFFASEAAMLLWILARNGMYNKDTRVETVPVDTVVEFDLDTNKLSTMEIVPKKTYPPVTTTNTVTTNTTGGTSQSGMTFKKKSSSHQSSVDRVSKNAFKRFKNQYLNKRVEWWCDSFVEANFPKTEDDGETLLWLMGEVKGIAEKHIVRTQVDLMDVEGPLNGEECCSSLWFGTVSDCSFDKDTGTIVIKLSYCYPAPINQQRMPPIIDAEYIRSKLDEEEKAKSALH